MAPLTLRGMCNVASYKLITYYLQPTENCTVNITRIGTVTVADNDAVKFNFKSGYNEENIWGSGVLSYFMPEILYS